MNSGVTGRPSACAHNLPYPYVVSITTGEPGSKRRSAGSYRLTAARRWKASASPLESLVITVWVAGPQVRWKSTNVPSLSNRIARIGIVGSRRSPSTHDQSPRTDATALIRGRIRRRGGPFLVAAVAAACLLD